MKSSRWLGLVLAAALSLGLLTGCGGGKDETKPVQTEAPTEAVTEAPTEAATEAQTQEPTEAPTEAGSGFALGTWNDRTFTNEWYDFVLTAGEDLEPMGAEEIREMLGLGTDTIVNDGVYTQEQMDAATSRVTYDFYLRSPMMTESVVLQYEPAISGLTPDLYLATLEDQLSKVTSVDYKLESGAETVKLGSHTYRSIKMSAYEGRLTQRYFVDEWDGYYGVLIVTYMTGTEQEAAMDQMLAGITSCK